MSQPGDLISRNDARITIRDSLRRDNYRRVLALLNEATGERGYREVELDFTDCAHAFPGPMLALCSRAIALRESGVELKLLPPKRPKLAQLFRNSNWAHYLAPAANELSRFRGHKHVPARVFDSSAEQTKAVNAILDVILRSMSGLHRADFAALEWSLNEITDNVLTHAEAAAGGLVQVTTSERDRRRVEFVVCDGGATIPGTLRKSRRDIASDQEALEWAVKEGVTRDPSVGQGNGLFGTMEICRQGQGTFHLDSRNARLALSGSMLHMGQEKLPFPGTLVAASIDCSKPGILASALKFGGQPYAPEVTKLEAAPEGGLRFVLHEETASFGSRPAGLPVRTKLANLVAMSGTRKVVVDCSGVPIVSSSFADEVFGKLFLELGPLRFSEAVQIVEMSDLVRALVDKALRQRMAGR